MEQLPAAQPGVPWTLLQTLGQLPQWEILVVSVISQPFAGLASQLPKPAVQTIWQEPFTQLGVPLVPLQAAPQELQFAVLVLRSTSQPLATLPSQLPKPDEHEMLHAPLTHEGIPFAFEQIFAQVPQCTASLLRSISQPSLASPLQSAYPAAQAMVQVELMHEGVP
jgi:hypothetical protein